MVSASSSRSSSARAAPRGGNGPGSPRVSAAAAAQRRWWAPSGPSLEYVALVFFLASVVLVLSCALYLYLFRTQWESFICMLMAGVDDPKTVYEVNGDQISKTIRFLSVRFASFDLNVEFFRSVFLVQQRPVPRHAPKSDSEAGQAG